MDARVLVLVFDLIAALLDTGRELTSLREFIAASCVNG